LPPKKPTRDDRIKHASRRRRKEDRAQLRQEILDAASQLFMERGYESFSLREVAEKIGYSPGTIYLYFDNKDDILFTLADEGFQRFTNDLETAVASADTPSDRLQKLGEAYVAFAHRNPTHYRLMFIERTDFMLRKTERDGESWEESFVILRQVVDECLAAGVLRSGDPAAISDALWAVLHGVVALGITMPNFDAERVKNAVEVAFEMIGRGIFTQF
jgi:AcrR family transcriptional regulator